MLVLMITYTIETCHESSPLHGDDRSHKVFAASVVRLGLVHPAVQSTHVLRRHCALVLFLKLPAVTSTDSLKRPEKIIEVLEQKLSPCGVVGDSGWSRRFGRTIRASSNGIRSTPLFEPSVSRESSSGISSLATTASLVPTRSLVLIACAGAWCEGSNPGEIAVGGTVRRRSLAAADCRGLIWNG